MDWYLDGSDPTNVAALRHQIRDYLARHAAEGSQIGEAEVVVSEVLTNAVRHTEGPSWVSLRWNQAQPELTVSDLGEGFDLDQVDGPADPRQLGGRGLQLVSVLAAELDVVARHSGGTIVRTVLPVERQVSESHDPPRRRTTALPVVDDAQPAGGFGKETFLRAIVVQLAEAVEDQQGPDAAERAVAQVGTDVGGQMETEYRQAKELVSRLTPDQIADCYVRLKHAIDGEFFVIEANEERIVLGNTQCPFGPVVQRSPALCRMTSSVFGGIGARNSDHGVTVLLEERIAVGDPQCRVVVTFDPADDPSGAGHRYLPPVED